MAKRPNSKPTAIGEIAEDVIKKLRAQQVKTSSLSQENLLRIHWSAIVGEKFASHTEVLGINHNIARVRVKNRIWAMELSYRKREILKKAEEILPDLPLKDIIFQ